MTKSKENILEVTRQDQYKTIDELFKRSEPGSVYYTLLILSAVIIAAGLLLNNTAIVIGGMLVTPVLTPMLLISLGLVVGDLEALKNVGMLMGRSFAIILLISFAAAVAFGISPETQALENTFRAAVLYFSVAFAAGVAATFAMVRKEIAEVLPGIAISVSLVPPLSLVGIWLSVLNLESVRFHFSVFLFNLIGIILGSFVVFSVLKFYKAEKKVTAESKKLEEQVKEKENA